MGGKLILWPAMFCSDEQAMWRVKMNDDEQAFSHLVGRWEKRIQGLALRMVGDMHRAQDLAQETFARLFAHRKNYEASARFSTFLWRTALNLCYDELRRNKRRAEARLDDPGLGLDRETLAAGDPCPAALLVENERADAVRKALLQLAEPYRAVVVLRHYQGLKFVEISAVLNIPEGTVKSRMAEALTQLHRLLQRILDDEPSVSKTRTESLLI